MKNSDKNESLIEDTTDIVNAILNQASVDDILKYLVNKIPSLFSEPEDVSVRIEWMDKKCNSISYCKDEVILSSDIVIKGEKEGSIEIAVKNKKMSVKEDADLLTEYEKILNTISRMVSVFLAKRNDYSELKARAQRTRSYCEKLEEHIFVVDSDGNITDFNLNFAECIGYPEEEIKGMNLNNILSQCSTGANMHTLLRDAAIKGAAIVDVEHKCSTGEIIPMSITCKLLDDSKDPLFICVAKDVSETKKAQNLLQKEKDRLENYLDVVGSIIGIVNSDSEIIFVNKVGAEVLGYPKEEIMGKNWFDCFLPESVREITRDNFFKVMDGEITPPQFFENLLLTKDGDERLIFWHDVPLEDENGKRIGMISSGEDITENKKMEAMLVDSEKNLKAIFDNVDDQIYIFRPYGYFVDVNKAVTESTGYAKEEMLEMTPQDILKQELRPLMEGYTRRIMKEKTVIYEISNVRKDGSLVPLEVNSRLIEYKGKEAIISVARDITERKKSEERLKRYAGELKQSNELKELFTDIIRHDLLTPASIIKGYTDELLDFVKDETACKLAVKIRDNNDRLIELLETATKLAKLQKDDDITFEKIDIVPIFKMVIESFKTQMDEKEQEIIITGDGKRVSVVNPVIEEVFVNLLSNAMKYSPKKSTIEVAFTDETNMWKVSVKDSGIGVPEKDKTLLFNRFQRADKKGIKGTGLGLAIVKRIIELHGGKYGVEDNPNGQGSVFWIEVKKG